MKHSFADYLAPDHSNESVQLDQSSSDGHKGNKSEQFGMAEHYAGIF